MPQVLSNRRISRDFYLMQMAQPNDARMGQFCMLRAWGRYPLSLITIRQLKNLAESVGASVELVVFTPDTVSAGDDAHDTVCRNKEEDRSEEGKVHLLKKSKK